jgi:hypothetical protein
MPSHTRQIENFYVLSKASHCFMPTVPKLKRTDLGRFDCGAKPTVAGVRIKCEGVLFWFNSIASNLLQNLQRSICQRNFPFMAVFCFGQEDDLSVDMPVNSA